MKHIIEIESKKRIKKNGQTGSTYLIYLKINNKEWPFHYETKTRLIDDFKNIIKNFPLKEKKVG